MEVTINSNKSDIIINDTISLSELIRERLEYYNKEINRENVEYALDYFLYKDGNISNNVIIKRSAYGEILINGVPMESIISNALQVSNSCMNIDDSCNKVNNLSNNSTSKVSSSLKPTSSILALAKTITELNNSPIFKVAKAVNDTSSLQAIKELATITPLLQPPVKNKKSYQKQTIITSKSATLNDNGTIENKSEKSSTKTNNTITKKPNNSKSNNSKSKIKVNWTNFFIGKNDNDKIKNKIKFHISPKDFLSFANKDFHNNDNIDKHKLINALSNAKRCIDCQIDFILSELGFNYLKFDDDKYPCVKDFIEDYEKKNPINPQTTFKLKFLCAIEIAPSNIISNIRNCRNKLEHEYTIPTVEDVNAALEVADLFLNATENKISAKMYRRFYFGNELKNGSFVGEYYSVCLSTNPLDNSMCIMLKRHNKIITHKNGTTHIETAKPDYIKTFSPKDKEYINLLQIMINHNFKQLPKILQNTTMDSKYVKYEDISKK